MEQPIAEAAEMLGPRPAAPSGKGNAVYYVQPDGLVRTIFRKPVAILSMLCGGDSLVLGTGNAGVIYEVTTDGDRITQLADTDAKQITALARTADGRILFATANAGSVGVLAEQFAAEGTYLSKVLDAKQFAKWGSFRCRPRVPDATSVTFATRSGNVSEPSDASWSDWSDEQNATDMFVPIRSPAARYLQYRLTLRSEGKVTPGVENVQIIYQVGNLPPAITGVTVKPSSRQRGRAESNDLAPKVYRNVSITASDPNKDKLTYKVEFRQIGTEGWICIAEDLKTPKYTWDTRTVGDGEYELRITASDSPDNPPGSALEAVRLSEPIVVDNTAPVVKSLSAQVDGSKRVRVTGLATDAASRIVAIHYAVDSQEDWVAVEPVDGICDTDSEQFSFDLDDLEPGPHRIAVRVLDLYNNAGYATVTVTAGR